MRHNFRLRRRFSNSLYDTYVRLTTVSFRLTMCHTQRFLTYNYTFLTHYVPTLLISHTPFWLLLTKRAYTARCFMVSLYVYALLSSLWVLFKVRYSMFAVRRATHHSPRHRCRFSMSPDAFHSAANGEANGERRGEWRTARRKLNSEPWIEKIGKNK